MNLDAIGKFYGMLAHSGFDPTDSNDFTDREANRTQYIRSYRRNEAIVADVLLVEDRIDGTTIYFTQIKYQDGIASTNIKIGKIDNDGNPISEESAELLEHLRRYEKDY